MDYIQGQNRFQIGLVPMCLEDHVPMNSPARVIDAFINQLDMLAQGFKNAEIKKEGRPPYNPAVMMKLYLYGYMNMVRSSRRLERETHRNIEVMWLMEGLTPDDRTISNFRKDNAKAIRSVYREFSKLCSKMDLYSNELIAEDGTKIRANSSRHNIYSQKKAEKALAAIEKEISKYMDMLDENDAAEAEDPRYTAEDIENILKALRGKEDNLKNVVDLIEENGGDPISIVDKDARIMKQGGDGRQFDACYNVQSTVDSKHHLIPDFNVTTRANDTGELFDLTESAKDIMGVDEIAVTADKGYYNANDIAKCEENGTTCYIPKTEERGHAPDPNYDKKHFEYDKDNDSYTCPEGNELPYKRDSYETKGVNDGRLYQDTKTCNTCDKRGLCTRNKTEGRTIKRLKNQDALDKVDARMKTREGRLILNKRKGLVEHPFGTVKKVWGYGQYLCRGLELVTAEQSMAFLAYNLRRVINIFVDKNEDLITAMGV